jgi:hypothetical protein
MTTWRVIVTDTETCSGIAPRCNSSQHPEADHEDAGVYGCCPEPHIETWSEALAARLVALLNGEQAMREQLSAATKAFDELQTIAGRLHAEVATVNEALNNVTDLLDEARVERDAALRQLEVDHGIPRAVHAAALRAIADLEQQRDEARAEVERLRHYTSTACHHGLHDSCGKAQHDRGEDGAPHCKWCPEPCRCGCHGVVRDGE